MIRRAIVDIDGVLADLVPAALEAHGLGELFDRYPLGEYDLPAIVDMSPAEFWGPINTHAFWSSLQPTPWHDQLLDLLATYEVMLATRPTDSPWCSSGKHEWIIRNFGDRFSNFNIGPNKTGFANDFTVLIDDFEDNVNEFRAAGGHAILFPAKWNLNYVNLADPVEYVNERLQELDGDKNWLRN